jgi:hypothetical protein
MKKIFTLFVAMLCSASLLFAVDLTLTGSFPDSNWDNDNPDYKMTEIGTSGVYLLEKTFPAGTYEFKIFNTGTWDGYGRENRKFTLTAEKSVRFYAKKNGDNNRFFSNAEEIYVMGDPVGGWEAAKIKLMTNSATDATYTSDMVAGAYKLIVKDQKGDILYDEITPNNMSVTANGNHTIKLDFATFAVSTTANGSVDPSLSALSSSYIFVGEMPEAATWYNASGTFQSENFHSKNLGTFTNPIYLGGELLTTPILEGVVVKMNYQIDELGVKEVILPFSANEGDNAKWKSTVGTNIFSNYTLTKGQTYNLNVWFTATKGETTLYDSNNSQNYAATFTYDIGTSATNAALNKNLQLITENGLRVVLKSKSQVELFTSSGQKMHSGVYDNEFAIKLNKGIYILQINGLGYKVAIR